MRRSIHLLSLLVSAVYLLGCTCHGKSCSEMQQEMAFPSPPHEELRVHPMSAQAKQYIQNLASRLMGYGKMGGFIPQVILTGEEEILVISSPGGLITISRGAVRQLEAESQFAFVLAHEIAHHLLGHTCSDRPEAELEFEADDLGAQMLFRSGYLPQAAPAALINAYQGIHYFEKDRRHWAHAKAHDRIVNLNANFARLGDSSLGTYDSLEFQGFRAEIIN